MTARGRRFLGRFVTMLVAGLAGILTVGALPAAADTVGIGQYVALGDSYAAGQGASAPDDYLNNCLQSPNGYPALLDAENQIHLRANAACTGATTSDVAEEQLSALKQGTRLVTLTVGAADLGLSRVLVACTAGTPAECQEAIRLANLLLPAGCGDDSELGRRLGNLYAEVAEAAPNALIVATGYPLLFELVPGDPDRVLKAQINDATTRLNCAIEKAVADAQTAGINIVYVDVTKAFDDHGIGGSKELFINPPPPPPTPIPINAFHPTPAGYVAYAAAISAALPNSWGANQE
jgi:lysophospholipase L1-like esterase